LVPFTFLVLFKIYFSVCCKNGELKRDAKGILPILGELWW